MRIGIVFRGFPFLPSPLMGRFSGRVGTDMGRKIGQYVVQDVMQPTNLDGSR